MRKLLASEPSHQPVSSPSSQSVASEAMQPSQSSKRASMANAWLAKVSNPASQQDDSIDGSDDAKRHEQKWNNLHATLQEKKLKSDPGVQDSSAGPKDSHPRPPPPTGTVDVDAKIKGYREARDEQLQTQCPNICVASESEVSSLPNTVDIEAKINARRMAKQEKDEADRQDKLQAQWAEDEERRGKLRAKVEAKGYREARDEQLQTQSPNICVASESEVSSLPNTVDIEAKINASRMAKQEKDEADRQDKLQAQWAEDEERRGKLRAKVEAKGYREARDEQLQTQSPNICVASESEVSSLPNTVDIEAKINASRMAKQEKDEADRQDKLQAQWAEDEERRGKLRAKVEAKGYREARDEQLQTQSPNICVASESEVSSLPNTVDIEAKINARRMAKQEKHEADRQDKLQAQRAEDEERREKLRAKVEAKEEEERAALAMKAARLAEEKAQAQRMIAKYMAQQEAIRAKVAAEAAAREAAREEEMQHEIEQRNLPSELLPFLRSTREGQDWDTRVATAKVRMEEEMQMIKELRGRNLSPEPELLSELHSTPSSADWNTRVVDALACR